MHYQWNLTYLKKIQIIYLQSFNFKINKTSNFLEKKNVLIIALEEKRVYYRVTFPFTSKPILAEAQYTYYDWFRSLYHKKGLYFGGNQKSGNKANWCIKQNYASIDILWYYFYY